jgi:general secretion pathway protein H
MRRAFRRRRQRAGTKGFTLIELLMVLVLLVAAAALVVPTTSRAFANLQLRLAARSVANLFQQAKGRALYEGRTYQVIFARAGQQLLLVREDGKLASRAALPAGIVLHGRRGDGPWTTEIEPLRFFPNGTSESIQIELRDARANRVALELAPLTGRVTVTDVQKAG